MSVSFNLKFYVGDEIFFSEINVNVLAEFTFTKLLELLHGLAPNEQLVGLKWIDVENESICLRNDADLAGALRNLHLVAGKHVLRVRLPQPAADLGKAVSAVGSSTSRMRSSSPTAAVSGVSTVPENLASSEYVLAIVCKDEVSDDVVQEAIGTAPSEEIGSSADIAETGGYIDLAVGVESAALAAYVKLEPKVEEQEAVQQEGSLDTAYLSATAATIALVNDAASHQAPDSRGRKCPLTEEEDSEPEEQNGVVESEATPNNLRVNAASHNAKRQRPNTPPPAPASTKGRTPCPGKAVEADQKVFYYKESFPFPGTPGSSGLTKTRRKGGPASKADKEKSAPRVKAPKATLAVKIAPKAKRNQSVATGSSQDKTKLKRLASVGGALVPAAKSARISLPSKRYDAAKYITVKQDNVSFTSTKPREQSNELVEATSRSVPGRNAPATGSKNSKLALGAIEDAALKQYRVPKIVFTQKPVSERPSAEEIHKSSTIKPAASRGRMKTVAPVATDSDIIKSNIVSKESHVTTKPLKGSSSQATPAPTQAVAAKHTVSAGSSVRKFSEDVVFAAAIIPERQESVHRVADRTKQLPVKKVVAALTTADLKARFLEQAMDRAVSNMLRKSGLGNNNVQLLEQFLPIGGAWQDYACEKLGVRKGCENACIRHRPSISLAPPSAVAKSLEDGNCFFRAISFATTGVQDYHLEIRRALTDWMEQNAVFLASITDYMPAYLRKSNMRTPAVWATHHEISALATMLQTKIYVYHEDNGAFRWNLYIPLAVLDATAGSDKDAIYLVGGNGHYDLVLDVQPLDNY